MAIGLNEGKVLHQALTAATTGPGGDLVGEILYVDSGSTDGSPEIAASVPGVRVLRLDDPRPSAAKGRNLGITEATGEFIQLLDGDCRLHPDWLTTALPALQADPDLAAVFGRCQEDEPEKSLYMRACQFDWHIPPGEYRLCGGNALWRRSVLVREGLFDADLPVGEEPDLCYRARRRGGRFLCLDAPMVRHDLDMTTFREYWGRAVRSGRGYAFIGMRYRREPEKLWLPEMIRHFLDPLVWIALFTLGCIWGVAWGFALLGLYLAAKVVRVAWSVRGKGVRPGDPWIYGVHTLFTRIPLVVGQLQGLWLLARRRSPRGMKADNLSAGEETET